MCTLSSLGLLPCEIFPTTGLITGYNVFLGCFNLSKDFLIPFAGIKPTDCGFFDCLLGYFDVGLGDLHRRMLQVFLQFDKIPVLFVQLSGCCNSKIVALYFF